MSGHKPDCNNFSVFPLYSRQAMLISRLFNRFLNLGIIQDNPAKSRNNSNYPEILCVGHLEIAPTVAPILTAAPYRNTLSKSYKISTGAHRCAPCCSTFRNPSPSSPPHHPITLTPDTGASPDAAISLLFCLQTHGLAHIMGEYDTGTMGGVAASAGAPAGRNGILRGGIQGIKTGPRIAPGPLKILCDGADCSRTLKNTM